MPLLPYLLLILLLLSVPFFLSLFGKKKSTPPRAKEAAHNWKPPPARRAPHDSLRRLAAAHGPVIFLRLGSVPAVVVSSAEALREIFTRGHDLALSGRPALHAAGRLSYGGVNVSFAPYGEYWRQARRVCVLELLSLRRVQSFMHVREQEVALLLQTIISSASSVPINLSELLHALTNKITVRVAFGEKFATGDYGGSGGRFGGVLERAQNNLGALFVADYFPWLGWVDALRGLRGRLEKNFQELDEFYEEVIEEHLGGHWPDPEHEDLVHVLLRLNKDSAPGSAFSSRDHIKGILTDIFIAGTDTSSATLSWTMTQLMKNPSKMKKLQQELREIIGNKGKVEEADLHRLTYLKLVIKEVLRLHPPAPLLVPRETIEKCTIKGYEVPSNTRVLINAKAIGLDPNSWENPNEFRPERFIDNDVDFRGQDFSFVPFGVGRRSCPGISFALVVVELALANLLYCFDWEFPFGVKKEDLDLEEAVGITVHRKNPLYLVAKPIYIT
uniref:Cytochrome P450 71A9 n=1 Tax=Ananas comosus var. bracteatus TaxID=296719 RepID=A0A6V7NP57_ANACO|nr:unnamed protein product [Ananas comosus var. bracteatus]